jgi:hypothetical protein
LKNNAVSTVFQPATVVLAAVGAIGLFRPGGVDLVPPCPLHALTGLDCPLCGATRATRALLLHGDIRHALDLNALYVVALPVIALVLVLWLLRGRVPSLLGNRRATAILGMTAVLFGVARNLPFAPFRYLRA